MTVSVVGAAAVWDYLFAVQKLPDKGGIVKVAEDCPVPYHGGCAPNIAKGLRRLGAAGVRLHYPVGGDAAEQGVLENWRGAGVDCSAVQVLENERSGAAWLYMQPDGCTMCFAHAGAADTALPDLNATLGEWVVIAPVLNRFTIPLLEKAVSEKKKVITTGICDEAVLPIIKDVGVLMVNCHEAEKLCATFGKKSLQGLADILDGTILYVTFGTKGSRVFMGGAVYEVPVIAGKQARDVTGAGDAFTTGVVFSLMRGVHPVDAAYVGACCASFVVEDYGGQTGQPDWPAVKKRLSEQVPGVIKKLTI